MKSIPIPKEFLNANGELFPTPKVEKSQYVFQKDKDGNILVLPVYDEKGILVPGKVQPQIIMETMTLPDVVKFFVNQLFARTDAQRKEVNPNAKPFEMTDSSTAYQVIPACNAANHSIDLEDSTYKTLKEWVDQYGYLILQKDAWGLKQAIDSAIDDGQARPEKRREEKKGK